jgi:sugar lactone lactonase YvrE
MDKYDVISNVPYRCGECPMWDADNQLFLWSDMLAGELFEYNPATGKVRRFAQGHNVSGFTLNAPGGLVCATHQGLYLWNEKDGWTLVATEFAGQALHSNDAAADPKLRGVCVLYPGGNNWVTAISPASRRAAEAVSAALVAETSAPDGGVSQRADLAGFNWSKVPVILIEMGFMTNKDEDMVLSTEEYQNKMAEGMLRGIEAYVKESVLK